MAWILMQQVAVIFLLMGIGIVLRKKKVISIEAAGMVSNLVIIIVIPSVIVQAFQRDLEREMLVGMGTAFLLAVLFHIMAVIVTKWLPRPRDDNRYPVERLLAICSNCGFMGIPLMTAVMGDVGTLYAAIYVAAFNLYLWSHGVMILRKTKRISAKELFCTPGMIGVGVGVTLFFLQLRLPALFTITLNYLAAMNTPLPTIITGVFLADISFTKALRDRHVYLATALRLLILPILFIGLIWVMRVPAWFPEAPMTALAMVICSSCSGAITTAMMPARYGGDASHGAALVAVSTLFSILTIPFVATLAQWLFTFT